MADLRERFVDRQVRRCTARGDLEAAIETLTAANRRRPSVRYERQILQLRNAAFHALPADASPPVWPPIASERFVQHDGVPEIHASSLDVDVLRDGVIGRGALIVRGLLSSTDVDLLHSCVGEAFAAYDRSKHGRRTDPDDPWFAPFESPDGPDAADHPRRWIRAGGGVYAAESPRAMFHLVEVIRSTGVDRLVEAYFGERAGLSLLKTTLRRVEPDHSVASGWHQDGAFLGRDVRSLNLWIALTACGRDAPGLQMVPHRLHEVVGAGAGNAAFSWSIETELIDRLTDGKGPAWLEFEAGDVIFFDELNLHSTATRPGMTKSRAAVEAWFFAASHSPLDRVPLLV